MPQAPRKPWCSSRAANRIVLQLPGIGDPQRVLALVGKTGALKFQLVCAEQPSASNQRRRSLCQSYPRKEDVDALIASKAAKGDTSDPTADELAKLPQLWVQTGSRATVDGADLTDAQPSFDQNNRAVVTFASIRRAPSVSASSRRERQQAVCNCARRRGAERTCHQRTDPGGSGQISVNSRPMKRRTSPWCSLWRLPAKLVCCGAANRRSEPRLRLDPCRPDRLCRGPRARRGLHGDCVRSLRYLRQHRAPHQSRDADRQSCPSWALR